MKKFNEHEIAQALALVCGSRGDAWICNSCGQKCSDISPLGPVGVVICEDCANPRNPPEMARQYMRENAESSAAKPADR